MAAKNNETAYLNVILVVDQLFQLLGITTCFNVNFWRPGRQWCNDRIGTELILLYSFCLYKYMSRTLKQDVFECIDYILRNIIIGGSQELSGRASLSSWKQKPYWIIQQQEYMLDSSSCSAQNNFHVYWHVIYYDFHINKKFNYMRCANVSIQFFVKVIFNVIKL